MTPPEINKIVPQDGECFYNCFKFWSINKGWHIVHGLPINTGECKGERYGHAWMENEDWAYCPSNDAMMPIALYHHFGKIEDFTIYSNHSVREYIAELEHAGPWEKKYEVNVNPREEEDNG